MPQEPNIKIHNKNSNFEIILPVPRRLPIRPAETIKPDFQSFGNVGPDSGFAMKIVNKNSELWATHPRKNLISNVIVNLILFRSAHFGRAPTTPDFHLILSLLRITAKTSGELTDSILDKCSKEKLQGLHLNEEFNFLTYPHITENQ